MPQHLARIALVVDDYDEALAFYAGTLQFDIVEDTVLNDQKRWVVVRPPGGGPEHCSLLLAKGVGEVQRSRIGNQTGGRVFLFLFTDDFARDHTRLLAAEVTIIRPPTDFPYGRVLVFADPYGNLWDLIQPSETAVL